MPFLMQEATELAELFQKVDAVFASGNLQRISSLLATMRRSLTMVGDVPEFDGGIKKLGVSLASQISLHAHHKFTAVMSASLLFVPFADEA